MNKKVTIELPTDSQGKSYFAKIWWHEESDGEEKFCISLPDDYKKRMEDLEESLKGMLESYNMLLTAFRNETILGAIRGYFRGESKRAENLIK